MNDARDRADLEDRDLLAAWRAASTEERTTWRAELRTRAIELARKAEPWIGQSIEKARREQERRAAAEAPSTAPGPNEDGVAIEDFLALMPEHRYIFRPTGELWPAESLNNRLPKQPIDGSDKPLKAAVWLDRYAPVEQMTWAPAEASLIEGWLIDQGGWIERSGVRIFNLYRPPAPIPGDAAKAGPWREHVKKIYPENAEHIESWAAHRRQRPGEKLNHALVLQGRQGIGKDTLLEPLKAAVGPWNWQEISPAEMLMSFNPWARAVVVRVNEARDLGEFDRYSFYDRSKTYIAAPPDSLRINAKFLNEYYVPNVLGVIITSNHEGDGLYLDPDDRRHYVASSDWTKEDFPPRYWIDLWRWYADGGIGHVIAFLDSVDLSGFDAKAPPPKTAAFWRLVHANSAPEDAGLADVIDALDKPYVLTLTELANAARDHSLHDVAEFLMSLKTRRQVQYRLNAAGYVVLHNQHAKDGLWVVGKRRQAIYAQQELSYSDAVREARNRGLVSDRR
jgi:hypothetical protein